MKENNKHINRLVNETIESLDDFHGLTAPSDFEQKVQDLVLGKNDVENFLMFRYVPQLVVLLLMLNIFVVYGQVKHNSEKKLKNRNTMMVSEVSCPELYSFLSENGVQL